MNLEELKAKAEAATPGPWAQGMVGDRLIAEVDYSGSFGFVRVDADLTDDGAGGVADAAFIAAANPETVLALVKVVEAVKDSENVRAAHPIEFRDWDEYQDQMHAAYIRAKEALTELEAME